MRRVLGSIATRGLLRPGSIATRGMLRPAALAAGAALRARAGAPAVAAVRCGAAWRRDTAAAAAMSRGLCGGPPRRAADAEELARLTGLDLETAAGVLDDCDGDLAAAAEAYGQYENQERQREAIAALRPDRPASVCFERVHGRQLWERVASRAECERARDSGRAAMRQACDSDGVDGRIFPPHVPEARQFLGDGGFALFGELRERVGERVRAEYGEDLAPVASLLSWISAGGEGGGGGGGGVDGGSTVSKRAKHRSFDPTRDALSAEEGEWDGTYAPHVDQANVPGYDVSARLYLSAAGVDFTGGLDAFNDADADRLLEPKLGRLLAFPSGFENLHQVRPVVSGERFMLSIWFQRQRDDGDGDAPK